MILNLDRYPDLQGRNPDEVARDLMRSAYSSVFPTATLATAKMFKQLEDAIEAGETWTCDQRALAAVILNQYLAPSSLQPLFLQLEEMTGAKNA